MTRILSSLIIAISLCLTGAASAQAALDAYIVRFKDDAERIVPAYDPSAPVAAAVPSAEVRTHIEDALDLDGEVLAIYPQLNGVLARMSAMEAGRLRADPRIERVELPPGRPKIPPTAHNNPQLLPGDAFSVQIPLVDHGGIPGLYQDATLEYSPQTGIWHLQQYRQAVPVQHIGAVKAIVTTETPVQVFLEVTGTLNNGCLELGQVGMNRTGDAFTVYLFYTRTLAEFQDCIGTNNVRDFRKIIPLDVYGLFAGTYSYAVNATFGGSFTLTADNVLE